MKKAIILLVLLFGCKSHKVAQKEKVETLTTIKKDSIFENKNSLLDSVFKFSNIKNYDYSESSTVIENPSFKTSDTKTISLKGLWNVNKTDYGAEAVNNEDTTKRALFDSANAKLTIMDNGHKKVYHNAIEFNASKITTSTKSYKFHSDSSYSTVLKKADSSLKVQATKDSTALAKVEKEHLDKGTKVSGWSVFVLGGVGLLIVLGGVLFIYIKTRK